MSRSRKIELLYRFLREHAIARKSFTLAEAIEFTGYMPSALKTNLSKHLRGVWVTPVDDKYFRVHDFEGVSMPAFTDAMSQNTRLSFEGEHAWRAQLRRHLALGIQHQFPVNEAVRDVLADLKVTKR
jgi:hypothetical protein